MGRFRAGGPGIPARRSGGRAGTPALGPVAEGAPGAPSRRSGGRAGTPALGPACAWWSAGGGRTPALSARRAGVDCNGKCRARGQSSLRRSPGPTPCATPRWMKGDTAGLCAERMGSGGGCRVPPTLVPTLRVGTPGSTLCVVRRGDAERPTEWFPRRAWEPAKGRGRPTRTLVPTLRVGTPGSTLCVVRRGDAERPTEWFPRRAWEPAKRRVGALPKLSLPRGAWEPGRVTSRLPAGGATFDPGRQVGGDGGASLAGGFQVLAGFGGAARGGVEAGQG